MIFANTKYFSTWATASNGKGNGRSRHDYDCTEHLISEMQTEHYWGPLGVELAAGDLIHVTDAKGDQAVFRIDWVDARALRAGFSIQERISEKPVAGDDGLAIKNRGPRGGLWCVLDGNGNIIESDHRTRVDAEYAREAIRKAQKVA